MAEGVRLVDAEAFATGAAGATGPLLVAQCWSGRVLSDLKLAVDAPEDQRAVLLHHLGLPGERVVDVAWPEIDRSVEADHLTSLWIGELSRPVGGELVGLAETIAELRRRCPWDRVQTHASLTSHLLEETYEAMEALDDLGAEPADATADQVDHVTEELGDLLCQVYFHATIAAEEGLFDLADVARRLNDKLVVRHPHVFGDTVAGSPAEVLGNWERAKHLEKARAHLFEGIPAALPALSKAAKFERKLASVGLGIGEPERDGAGTAGDAASTAAGEAEAGNAASTAAGEALLRLARSVAAAGVDPEAALRRALDGLAGFVRRVEERAGAAGKSLSDAAPAEVRRWSAELASPVGPERAAGRPDPVGSAPASAEGGEGEGT